ncbi:hypothetical protein lerEdw1_019190 [Lerista edwardsae]|nr:hypothetical protein lerEdw1_019190 [Lerista edwardsae]
MRRGSSGPFPDRAAPSVRSPVAAPRRHIGSLRTRRPRASQEPLFAHALLNCRQRPAHRMLVWCLRPLAFKSHLHKEPTAGDGRLKPGKASLSLTALLFLPL